MQSYYVKSKFWFCIQHGLLSFFKYCVMLLQELINFSNAYYRLSASELEVAWVRNVGKLEKLLGQVAFQMAAEFFLPILLRLKSFH